MYLEVRVNRGKPAQFSLSFLGFCSQVACEAVMAAIHSGAIECANAFERFYPFMRLGAARNPVG
jgi:hypothetical protein